MLKIVSITRDENVDPEVHIGLKEIRSQKRNKGREKGKTCKSRQNIYNHSLFEGRGMK